MNANQVNKISECLFTACLSVIGFACICLTLFIIWQEFSAATVYEIAGFIFVVVLVLSGFVSYFTREII